LLNRLKEKEEKIGRALDALRVQSSKGVIILVEGKKDEEALRVLGVEGKIITVKTGGKSFLDVVSMLQEAGVSEVILLLDFDRRGSEGTKRLKQSLERVKIKPNLAIWREISGLIYRDVQCVESIPSYVENLAFKIKKSG
jgi:5S rRNA maturation endonuclease (ribonuclease M5)